MLTDVPALEVTAVHVVMVTKVRSHRLQFISKFFILFVCSRKKFSTSLLGIF